MNATADCTDMSPRTKARITGAVNLSVVLLGVLGGVIVNRLVATGDPEATAGNLLAHEPLLRLAFAAFLVEMICNVAAVALFYELLKPAGKSVSLLAAFVGLAACTIKTVSRLFLIAPVLGLGGGSYLSAFRPDQLHVLVFLSIRVNDLGTGLAMVFFGVYALLTGALIFRSTFLPRFLGVLGMIGGCGWLSYLWAPLAHLLFPYVLGFAVLGILILIGWLLVVGVDEQRWRAAAGRAATSIWA
jgi:Domain of unknown function (DUF4386)